MSYKILVLEVIPLNPYNPIIALFLGLNSHLIALTPFFYVILIKQENLRSFEFLSSLQMGNNVRLAH